MNNRVFSLISVVVAFGVAALGLTACTKQASKPAQVQTLNQNVEPRLAQDVLVEKSHPARPEWTLKPYVKQKETVEFSGGVKGVSRYEVGVRQAKEGHMAYSAGQVSTSALPPRGTG